jgi:hypothetical protein
MGRAIGDVDAVASRVRQLARRYEMLDAAPTAGRKVVVSSWEGDNPMPGNNNSDQHDPDPGRTTTIVLAEFAGLRGEIATRVNLLVTLILGNLTVLGVVFGIALSRSGNTKILLVLPLVTPSIGLLYLDQSRELENFGVYISKHIRPQLKIPPQLKVNDVEAFGWESWIVKRQSNPWIASPYLIALVLQFLGPPIAVLVYGYPYRPHPLVAVSALQIWLWWTGAVLTSGLIFYAIIFGIHALRNPRSKVRTELQSRQVSADELGKSLGGTTETD